MIEKVNPSHPDKIADRIAGAIVDLAYQVQSDPKIAVEVLIGHGVCHIVVETSAPLLMPEALRAIHNAVRRIAGMVQVDLTIVPQDTHLADNQSEQVRCGDNGIFKGMPLTEEQEKLSKVAQDIYARYPTDGKYILNGDRLIICQSNAETEKLRELYPNAEINPIGDWTGGTDVDTASSAPIWRIPSPEAGCTAKTCPKQMCRSTFMRSRRHRFSASRSSCAAPSAILSSTADPTPKS